MTHPLTIRLDDEDIAKLDALAKATDRKRAWHMSKAIKAYIEEESEFMAGVQEGIASAERGDFIAHDDMVSRLHAITSDDR